MALLLVASTGTIHSQQETELRFGAPEVNEQAVEQDDSVSSFGGWDLLRMVLVLMMVVGTVYGIVSFLRRKMPDSFQNRDDSPISVLASQSLAPGRELHAVKIGEQVLLLGSADSSIQLITTVEEKQIIDELILFHSREKPQTRTFGSLLAGLAAQAAVPGSASPDEKAQQKGGGGKVRSLLSSQRERLRNLS